MKYLLIISLFFVFSCSIIGKKKEDDSKYYQHTVQNKQLIKPYKKPNPEVVEALSLEPQPVEEGKIRTFKNIESDVIYDTRKIRSKIAGLIFPEINEVPEPVEVKVKKPVYCYKSSADAVCYSEPIEGQEFRRLGKD